MPQIKNFRRPLLKFFLLTYLIFLVLLLITGIAIMMKAPELVKYILPIVCSWSPTFAFLILFKRLYPGLNLKEFLKQRFYSAIKIKVIVTIITINILILILTMVSYSIKNNTPITAILVTSSNIIVLGFFTNLIRGPLGEELGWRGYALNVLQQRFSPLISAIIIGVIWGFWHTPLWFLTSGYSGVDLIKYIMLFMICIISVSIYITTFYNLNKNLVIPILIHQLYNYSLSVINLNALQALSYIAPLYLILAIILVSTNKETVLYKAHNIIEVAENNNL